MIETSDARKKRRPGIPGFVFVEHNLSTPVERGENGEAEIQPARKMPTSSRAGLREPTRWLLPFNRR